MVAIEVEFSSKMSDITTIDAEHSSISVDIILIDVEPVSKMSDSTSTDCEHSSTSFYTPSLDSDMPSKVTETIRFKLDGRNACHLELKPSKILINTI